MSASSHVSGSWLKGLPAVGSRIIHFFGKRHTQRFIHFFGGGRAKLGGLSDSFVSEALGSRDAASERSRLQLHRE